MVAESREILESAISSTISGYPQVLTGRETVNMSERCVEVPWIASCLSGYDKGDRILDVGWTMSSPEWFRVLLSLQENGVHLVGLDIVSPQRVTTRYPSDIADDILATPFRNEDFLSARPIDGLYDAIACLSTLEHIGFDEATSEGTTDSVFVRSVAPTGANDSRDPDTDIKFLDAAWRLLRPGGALLISVPAGSDKPILHRDSLGLYTYQFEYGVKSWERLTGDTRFRIEKMAFYRYSDAGGWQSEASIESLTDQTSALKPFATACAMVHMCRL